MLRKSCLMVVINEKAGLMKDLIEYTNGFQQKPKFIGLIDAVLQSVERCKAITHRLLVSNTRFK